jgi:hypothetical protein
MDGWIGGEDFANKSPSTRLLESGNKPKPGLYIEDATGYKTELP